MINVIKRWVTWLTPRPKPEPEAKAIDSTKLERAAEKRQRKNLKRSAQMQTQNSEGFYENQ
jgi:hypothetical protein